MSKTYKTNSRQWNHKLKLTCAGDHLNITSHIFRHPCLVEGPGWSGIGFIQYIWAYYPVHTFEVKGGAIYLKVSRAIKCLSQGWFSSPGMQKNLLRRDIRCASVTTYSMQNWFVFRCSLHLPITSAIPECTYAQLHFLECYEMLTFFHNLHYHHCKPKS